MKKLLLLLLVILAGCGGGSSIDNNITNSPSCNTTVGIVPNNYLGTYSIPTPNKKLNNNIQRSMGLKDAALGINTCDYITTLDRLQTLGVDRVWVYNYGIWDDFNKDVWTTSDWQISKKDFTTIVTEAKKRNIKVFLAFQFTSVDLKGNSLPWGANVSESTLTKMLNSHHQLIVDYVKYGQTIGLAGVSLDWNAFYIPNLFEFNDLWSTHMVSIAKDIRANFSGTIVYGQSEIPHYDSRIFDVVDEIHVFINEIAENKIYQTNHNNINVELLKAEYLSLINDYYIRLHNTNKPVQFEISIQSRDKYYTEGWIEDGFCVNNCIQNSYVTDFSVQAIGVEAALEAIAEQTKFVTKSVNFHTSYWFNDSLSPGNLGFPNLSESIRGKPAEAIVKYWFGHS